MRRIRRGLKRLWRMSDPYYAAKDDGLVGWAPERRLTPAEAHSMAQRTVEYPDEFNRPHYQNDPSYDWVAETRRAKMEKANGKTA
jgi:hypothetical protein